MIRSLGAALAVAGAAVLAASCGQPVSTTPYPIIDTDRMRTHLERLQAAAAAGLGPGSAGERAAVEYLRNTFTDMGVTVQAQPVTLTKIRPTRVTLSLSGTRPLVQGSDFVAWTRRHEPVTSTAGEMVFVGYGISAARQGWDDYKDVDVKGKILLMLIGDPMIGQRHLLGTLGGDLFGRRRYKFQEAARRGAVGVMLVHLDGRTEATWDSLRAASTEILDPGSPGDVTAHLPLEGWLSTETARTIFTDAALDFDEAMAKADEANFRPVTLPVQALAQVESEISVIHSANVIASIPAVGKPQEYVLFSTEWSTLPAGSWTGGDLTDADPRNQAPPGAPVMLELARALSRERTPHRGFVFLVVTAAPQGLLGLEAYLEDPLYSRATTRAAIHIAGFDANGGDEKALAFVGIGYEALKGLVREEAADQFRVAAGDLDPERLRYFRSAREDYTLRQIPSVFLSSGRPHEGTGQQLDMSVGALDARLLFHVGMRVATTDNWPAWTPSRSLADYAPAISAMDEKRRARVR